jgi:hypothetical protein
MLLQSRGAVVVPLQQLWDDTETAIQLMETWFFDRGEGGGKYVRGLLCGVLVFGLAASSMRASGVRADGSPPSSGSTNPPGVVCCGGGGGPVTGVYASFGSSSQVSNAGSLGWQLIADTSGLGQNASPYTHGTGQDSTIVQGCKQGNCSFTWVSFWTVSSPAPGDTWYNDGKAAAAAAANELKQAAGSTGLYPAYVILDPEGTRTPVAPGPNDFSHWADWYNGWTDGINASGIGSAPGLYVDESQYKGNQMSQFALKPIFVAETPIQNWTPTVTNTNVTGYIAYYAVCRSGSDNLDVNRVTGWGKSVNTVQFSDSGVDCAP